MQTPQKCVKKDKYFHHSYIANDVYAHSQTANDTFMQAQSRWWLTNEPHWNIWIILKHLEHFIIQVSHNKPQWPQLSKEGKCADRIAVRKQTRKGGAAHPVYVVFWCIVERQMRCIYIYLNHYAIIHYITHTLPVDLSERIEHIYIVMQTLMACVYVCMYLCMRAWERDIIRYKEN